MGKCLLAQLPSILKQFPNVTLCMIASSKKSISAKSSDNSLSLDTWERDLAAAADGSSLHAGGDWLRIITRPDSLIRGIVIDVTSSQVVASGYAQLISQGVSVVTANKKAFSGSLVSWNHLLDASRLLVDPSMAPGLLYHESSVGAGLPIISTLKDLLQTGDVIHEIQGVFSGTMSFLFNSFAPTQGQGGKWSEEVKKAKDLGYTEPDPRDDLNGVDVARKAVILARLSGLEVEDTNSFPVESLIPKALESVASSDEFISRLPEFDDEMEKVKTNAETEGKVVRFVGSIDVSNKSLRVGLENFEKGHPVASLKGSDNIFVFYTKRYGKNPLVIQGAGAGGEVTAMGVMSDLTKVIERLS